jgi:tripartite motif-containing protein 71
MRAIRLLIVTMALGTFSELLQAEEAYHVVKVWPEMPLGWHFYQPFGVAVDQSGNVYVGDSGSYRIKKLDSEGRFITQWGSPGQGDGQFTTIHSVKVGRSGTVYVVDEDDRAETRSRIQKFTPYGQFIGLFERTAPDVNKADLSIDVTEDDRGNVFVLAIDYVKKESRIRHAAIEKYSPAGEFIAQWGLDAGSGDGQLQIPMAIAVDAKGNFYIVELYNNRVQKFDPSGEFLLSWETSRPRSIAVDKDGDVFVLDGRSVQKFTPEGKFLATWKTKPGSRGIALDSDSNVYVTCMQPHNVLKFDSTGKMVSVWGSAGMEVGRFLQPGGIAADPSGHILVTDVGNLSIQRFTSEGRFVSQWGGWTDSGAWNLATDTSGNVYAACGDANEVQKFDPDGRLIRRWGSSGSGDGQFRCLSAVALSPSDDVYVIDTFNNRVQKFTSDGKFLAKWGTEGTGDGQFDEPFFIAADRSGNVWVGDQLGNGTHRMQKFDANGKFLAKWTRKITRPWATNYTGAVAVDSAGNSYYAFENRIEKYDAEGNLVRDYGQEEFAKDAIGPVRGASVDQAGCLYVTGPADPNAISLSASGSIRRFDADGRFVTKWTAENTDVKEPFPNGPIAVDRAGNMYTMCSGSQAIQKLSSDGKLVAEAQLAAPREGRFSNLGGVAVDGSGKVYAVNSIDVDWAWSIPSIKLFDPNGQFLTMWDVPEAARDRFKYPVQIAVDGAGNVYVTDQNTHCVHKLDAQGKYIKSWGGPGAGDGQFVMPEGIAVDGAGHVYVCDRQNSRIQKFDSDGNFLAKWGKEGSGDGEFHFPAAVAVDNEGNVFVADSDNHRIQKFTAEGKFLAKWGEFGEAPGQFNVPLGIAVDEDGNVYVSDSHNQRIQKFAPQQIDLSGKWSGFEAGSDWGWVTIQGNRGTYTDTYGPGPGKLEFHRTGRNAYSGTWGESDKRHGIMSFTVSDDGHKIIGTYEADKDVTLDPHYRTGIIYWIRQ